MNKLSRIWKASQISRELKLRVFRITVKATLLYGSQCWTLTAAHERSLDGTYTHPLRKAFNNSYKNYVPSVTLYRSLPPIS